MTAPNGFLVISVNAAGIDAAERLVTTVESRVLDLRPAWPEVLSAFRAIVSRAFESEGASTADGPWNELAPSTVQSRARAMAGAGEGFSEGGPAHPILQRSGKLKRALTLESSNSAVRMTPTSLTVQVSPEVSYFAFHQSTGPRHKLPRRAPVSLTADDRNALMEPIRRYLVGGD